MFENKTIPFFKGLFTDVYHTYQENLYLTVLMNKQSEIILFNFAVRHGVCVFGSLYVRNAVYTTFMVCLELFK